MNGHTDDEIKRQRLHYSSDQLYSVSILINPIKSNQIIGQIKIKAMILLSVNWKSKITIETTSKQSKAYINQSKIWLL